MKKCINCGAENPDSGSYCTFCGKPLGQPPVSGPRLQGQLGGKNLGGSRQTDVSDSQLKGTILQSPDSDPDRTQPADQAEGSRLWVNMGGNRRAPDSGKPVTPASGPKLWVNMGGRNNIPQSDADKTVPSQKYRDPNRTVPTPDYGDPNKTVPTPDYGDPNRTVPAPDFRDHESFRPVDIPAQFRATPASSEPQRAPAQKAQTFCPHCGAAISPDMDFCTSCGKPTDTSRRHSRKGLVLVLIALLAAALIGLVILGFVRGDLSLPFGTEPEETSEPAETAAPTNPPETTAPTSPPETAAPTSPPETAPTQSDVPLWMSEPFNPSVWRGNLMTEDPFSALGLDREKIYSVEFRRTTFDFTTDDIVWNLGKGSTNAVIGTVVWRDSMANVIIAADGAINGELCAAGLFQGCTNLRAIYGLENLRVMDARSLSRMFYGCQKLNYIGFNGPSWNTSKVTNMSEMFRECMELTEQNFEFLKYWDTSNVTNMSCMFSTCNYLEYLDLSMFDTSRVTNMSYMFSACRRLKQVNVSGFNTSRVTNMEGMFRWCHELEDMDLGGWDISKATNHTGFMEDGKTIGGRPWKEFFQ